MITVLRGSSGSGKTYTGRRLVQTFDDLGVARRVMWPPGVWPNSNKLKEKLMGYELPGGLFVLGSYHGRSFSGGADLVGGGAPKVQLPFIKRAAAKYPHVFAESLMLSMAAYWHWTAMAEEMALIGQGLQLPVLDTPADLCRDQIYLRNGNKPIKEETTVYYAHRRTHKEHGKIIAAGLSAPIIRHGEDLLEQVLVLMRAGGWDPGIEIGTSVPVSGPALAETVEYAGEEWE